MIKKSILIIDDDIILLKTAEEILSDLYSVSVAKGGKQGIALLKKGIIPNLICEDIIKAIDESKAPIMYCCNIVTQPGETDDFKASDHIKLLNSYLGKRKIDVGIFNKEKMDPKLVIKYETEEQKDPVILDVENLDDIEIIADDLITSTDGTFKHDTIKLALDIFEYLLRK